MTEMKRRVIYMTDDDWEELRGQSQRRGLTMSEIIRRTLHPTPGRPVAGEVLVPGDPDFRPARHNVKP